MTEPSDRATAARDVNAATRFCVGPPGGGPGLIHRPVVRVKGGRTGQATAFIRRSRGKAPQSNGLVSPDAVLAT